MKLSFHTLTYTNYSLKEAIRRIAKIGYDGVELMAIRPHAWPGDMDDAERKEILSLLKSLDVEASAIANYSAVIGLNPSSPREKIRAEAVQYTKECIGLASDIESKIVMLIPGWVLFGAPYEQAWKWAVDGLKECVPLAEDKEVVLAIEPALNLLNSIDKAIKMMKEVASKNVRICLDTYHAQTGEYGEIKESLADCVTRLGRAIAHVHVWDEAQSIPAPPGKGSINFEVFIRALKEIGYNGYLSVELPKSIEPDGIALESKRYLDRLLKTI